MATRPAPRRRVLNADRLYTAAILIGAALVPHLAFSLADDWSAKPFNLHLAVVLLLVAAGWRVDIIDAQVIKRPQKSKKDTPSSADEESVSDFDAIARRLRDDNNA